MPSWNAPLAGPGLAVDLAQPIDLSLRIRFDSSVSCAFGLPAATSKPILEAHDASCNCASYTITPHGDGTHTEGVGHLLEDDVPVIDLMTAPLLPALLVDVAVRRLEEVPDDVAGNHGPDDLVLDESSLHHALDDAREAMPPGFDPRALIVRTNPVHRIFSGKNPPYFTIDAIHAIVEQGFDHLLVDLPSLDRENDGGLLGAHRAFFALLPQQKHLDGPPPRRTVTELCSIPKHLDCGPYALSLQLAPLVADAVPSRPLLFPIVVANPSWLRSR